MLNRFAESIPRFEKYIKSSENNENLSECYYWLGSAYLEQQRINDARRAWEKSREPAAIKNLEILDIKLKESF